MESKFKLTLILLVFTSLFVSATEAEYTRGIRKAWAKNGITALKIVNKFGEVKIDDQGGDSITVKVLITIDNPSSSKAKDLMDKIKIDFQRNGGQVSAETEIDENFRSKQSFSIDYLINIPKDRELNVTNKYGNVIVNELNAKGYFDVSYGSLTAGKIKAPAGNPVKMIVNYGKANLETINDGELEFKYSKLYADEITNLVLDTKYSTVNLHKTNNLVLESKYDGINIDEVDKFKSVSKYTNYKIGLLTESFDLNTGYGSVRIGKVEARFSQIKITNSYGGLSIGLNGLNYKLQADCQYCDVKYPSDRFKGNKSKDDQHLSISGNVGTGGGSVIISSSYGGVKLEE